MTYIFMGLQRGHAVFSLQLRLKACTFMNILQSFSSICTHLFRCVDHSKGHEWLLCLQEHFIRILREKQRSHKM